MPGARCLMATPAAVLSGGPLDSYICPAPRRCEPEAKDQSREQAHHRNANRDQAHFRRIHLANPLSGRDRRKRGGEGYEKHLTMPTRRHASSLKPVASSANRAWRGIGRVRDGQPLGELACLLIGHRVRSTGPLVSGLSEGAHTRCFAARPSDRQSPRSASAFA